MIQIIRIKDVLTSQQIEKITENDGLFTLEPYPFDAYDYRHLEAGEDFGSIWFFKDSCWDSKCAEELLKPAPFTGFYAGEAGSRYPLDPLTFESYCGATNGAAALDANPIFAIVGDTIEEIKEWQSSHSLETYINRDLRLEGFA